jgi:hypothetical protein
MYVKSKFTRHPCPAILPLSRPMILTFVEPKPFSVTIESEAEGSSLILTFEEAIDSDMHRLLYMFRSQGWPDADAERQRLGNFLEEQRSFADERATQVARTYLYRCGSIGPLVPFVKGEAYWSLDGEEWHPFPPGDPILFTPRILPELDVEEIRREVKESAAHALRYPISNEILAEAWELTSSAPRRAVVVGVGALEIAVKAYIAHHLSLATWLINNLPSPPVFQLLRDYLPTLGPRSLRLPSRVLTILNKGIKLRNDLAHPDSTGPLAVWAISPTRSTRARTRLLQDMNPPRG